MTTNLAETMNSVLKATQNLPITSLVQSTYFWLGASFGKRDHEWTKILASGQTFTDNCINGMAGELYKYASLYTPASKHLSISKLSLKKSSIFLLPFLRRRRHDPPPAPPVHSLHQCSKGCSMQFTPKSSTTCQHKSMFPKGSSMKLL
ncbi:uncharacterized protein LOC131649961 [Vicia villosa]|uniref:uncharacterized protein LOC131649961 n=1 Tax=Vicia villosa TaxID=3911 RepID=UPI00273C4BDF|nr:uncharacterized protein LOC131649961 [Vicia villosa]